MARRRNKEEWISGIEQHGKRWRFKVGSGATTTARYSFGSKEEAETEHCKITRAQRRLEEKSKTASWQVMIEEYLKHETERGKATARSIETLAGRLKRFFEPVIALPLKLTPELGKLLYQKLRERTTRRGSPISIQEQHHALSRAKAFISWLVKQKLLPENHLKDLEPVGRPSRGKPQLTRDESVELLSHCLTAGSQGDEGAVATLLAILLGLRASEITERIVRDLDGRGTLLHITRAKTEAGVRTLKIPAVLQPLLLSQAREKSRDDKLFSRDRWWVRREVRRLCREAKVPVVPPHGLRGTHASLARQAGAAPELVAASLGHAGTSIQDRHYVKREAADEGRQSLVERAVLGK